MLTVIITYLDDTTDIKACNSLDELCLDNVLSVRVIRDERTTRKVA